MSLMNLVRLIGAMVVAWTLVAMGLGAAGVRLAGPETAEVLVRESPPVDALPTAWPKQAGLMLIDRRDGRRAPIRLPSDCSWSLIGISPWHTPGAELEAVGLWVSRTAGDFCGWGLFRPSDGAWLGRLATDVLPTGRPCWVPGDPRTIVFAAGDGQLYRCRLPRGDDEPVDTGRRSPTSGRPEPSEPLVWESPPPGPDNIFLSDPIWPDLPRSRSWIVASLRHRVWRQGQLVYGPARIWWLEIRDGGGAIVATGRLTAAPEGDTAAGVVEHRFPNVAVGPGGVIRLVYLERLGRDPSWRLRSVPLVIDERTGRPAVGGGADGPARGPDQELQSAPLLVSADGATVFGLLRSGGVAALPAAGRPGGD